MNSPDHCVNPNCHDHGGYPAGGGTIRKGRYRRKVDGRIIQRYQCRRCRVTFSVQTGSLTYRMGRADVNPVVLRLLTSGVSQRRVAILAKTCRGTVARRLMYFSSAISKWHQSYLRLLPTISKFQADEIETFEHSKMKPLSVPLIVGGRSRIILGFDVASMPARSKHAAKARKKYGYRPDHRREAFQNMLRRIKPLVGPNSSISTDMKSTYPNWIKSELGDIKHFTYKGRKGAVVGQGELKEGGYDPLFFLNHTAAMLRDNIKTLSRRTWATTKKPECLWARIMIYVFAHNHSLIPRDLMKTAARMVVPGLAPLLSEAFSL